jgi:hypothetical protein
VREPECERNEGAKGQDKERERERKRESERRARASMCIRGKKKGILELGGRKILGIFLGFTSIKIFTLFLFFTLFIFSAFSYWGDAIIILDG